MKKVFLTASMALVALSSHLWLSAQTPVIVETFDDKVWLDWEEFADKTGSGLVKGGFLELVSKEALRAAVIYTELPVSVEHDFKLTAKIRVPKLDNKKFGFIIDLDEELNSSAFLLQENAFNCYILNDGKWTRGQERPVKLRGGRNQAVEIVLERLGGKYIFSVNNMRVFEWRKEMTSPTFGFYTEGGNTILIDEFRIEQEYSGRSEQ